MFIFAIRYGRHCAHILHHRIARPPSLSIIARTVCHCSSNPMSFSANIIPPSRKIHIMQDDVVFIAFLLVTLLLGETLVGVGRRRLFTSCTYRSAQ